MSVKKDKSLTASIGQRTTSKMKGKHLRLLRDALGKTQDQFAVDVDYESNTIAKLETGARRITPWFQRYLQKKYPKAMAKLGLA